MALPLVSTDWLAEHGGDPDVLVLEVCEETARYYAVGHVPGASPVDWLDDLHHPVRRSFLDPEACAALLTRLGATADTHVVLLGDGHNQYAAGAFWLLRHYGHRRLSLVDGGKQAWLDEGRPLTDEPAPERAPGDYPVPVPDPAVRATRDDVLSRFVDAVDGRALLDCRTPEEFDGRGARGVDLPVERHRVPGHVPGARNLDSAELLVPGTARFRPAAELRDLFASRGVDERTEVVLYCRLAERSSLLWFALHEILGHEAARNYDGGWAEYGSLVDAPVER